MSNRFVPHNHLNYQKGWTSIEFLVTLPLLFAAFLMVVYFSLLLNSKIALTNATYSGVQAYAKTEDCDLATEYVKANFDHSEVHVACIRDGDRAIVSTQFSYAGSSILMLSIPTSHLSSRAVALFEEPIDE